MARDPKYTYNPCDDCKYNFSYNNQEMPICKMCELKYFSAEYVAQKSEVEKLHEVIFKKEDLMQKIAKERNQYSDEVERLERICNSYALQYGTVTDQQKVIDKAKAEVAREIFEEIEKICVGMQDYTEYAELKKKYQEGEPNGQNIKE